VRATASFAEDLVRGTAATAARATATTISTSSLARTGRCGPDPRDVRSGWLAGSSAGICIVVGMARYVGQLWAEATRRLVIVVPNIGSGCAAE
jgi:hypothetical protein